MRCGAGFKNSGRLLRSAFRQSHQHFWIVGERAFMRYEVRELGLGGILDQAVKLTRDQFGVLLGITGVLLIPYNLISGFVQLFSAPKLPPNPTPEQILPASVGNL